MNLLDYINSILNTWGTPVKELIGLVTAIVTIGGAGPYIVRWIRKSKSKDISEENEKKKGSNRNTAWKSPVRNW